LVPFTFFLPRLLRGHIKPKNIRFELRYPDLINDFDIFVIFRNNLNGFLDLNHGTNMDARSPKAS
jgi:hypothetical protein